MRMSSFFDLKGGWRRMAVAATLVLAAIAHSSPAARADLMPAKDTVEVDRQLPTARKFDGGIRFFERKPGTGPRIAKGDQVTALYAGRFLDGKVFNQKRSLNHSFTFEVGANPRQIVLGWERAILHMQARRQLHHRAASRLCQRRQRPRRPGPAEHDADFRHRHHRSETGG